ncbi:MAG: glucose 1-dehydrogenase [Faecalibacterium sp.]|nr:glucose 1-dehydrogenase [Ruminococcus sp.]MCM1392438.1 glucose 1-dehydrogenase [Ruminococcus sp.]MCM1486189.1 glucose 1-dehydrogenase [Faecalibacterium sp.]
MQKTALITGATGGIGEALCRTFAKNGYNIIAHCFKNEQTGKNLCCQLEEEFHIKTHLIKANLANRDETKLLAQEALSFGNVDVLINNAGIAHQNLFQCVDDEKAHEIFLINAENTVLLTKEIIQNMISRHSGKIINISSMWGITGGSCEVHYSASKAAIIGFTKALAKEVGPSSITVNCIAPGLIDTKMNGHLDSASIAEIIEETPLSRIGKPQDVASLAAFLASEDASFITGQIISVDGGLAV